MRGQDVDETVAFPIRIGPAGWSYADWEGVVYPKHGKRFDPLSYLASYFDLIEVNSSFYRIPPQTHARSWIRRVDANPDFRFAIKLYRAFTHEEPADADVAAFRTFLDPLRDAGRLSALLVQFPWSFKRTDESMARIERLLHAFRDYSPAVEVRHATFEDPGFYRFLDDHGAGFVNIDQPLFGDSVRPSAVATGPVGYVRFHGRNYAKWFAHKESWERYDYLYSREELEPWIETIRTIAKEKEVLVVTNNHFRGQAIVNAVEIRQSLGLGGEVPPPLKEAYPERFA